MSNKARAYREHYEKSMNDLIADFESNLDLSPILRNKSAPKSEQIESEEKEREIKSEPDCHLQSVHLPIPFTPQFAVLDDAEGGEDEDEDDEHLFMPISPTLSGSALRALLSSLRIKCKRYAFKSKQQSKFIIDCQAKMSEISSKYKIEQLHAYDIEQRALMLESGGDEARSLEYLRGAELHQTRQELVFLMQRVNELEAERNRLRQHCKLQQIERESHCKSVGDEIERMQRELCQHKVLYDQRGRELDELKKSGSACKNESEQSIKKMSACNEEQQQKLEKVSKQMAELRDNYEQTKKKYDGMAVEKDEMSKLIKSMQLQMDERDQRIVSLQRVRDNLEQEIDALSRSNRHCRQIRNKSTSQLLESQGAEIEAVKAEIGQKYEEYLSEERRKNESLQQLIKEKNAQIGELQSDLNPFNVSMAESDASSMDEFGSMMLKAAKQEIESLRQTNEKLMQLHAKNHFKKPRVQDQVTQTVDEDNNSINSSFCSFSTQTEPEKGDTVLINSSFS